MSVVTNSRTITEDTRVVVRRTVQVSTEWSLAELAEATGEDVADVVQSFKNRAGDEWIRLYHVPELVPDLSGNDLDADVWTVRRAP